MSRTSLDTFKNDDVCLAFVMHCDERNLSVEAGIALAESLADALVITAENRSTYARREA